MTSSATNPCLTRIVPNVLCCVAVMAINPFRARVQASRSLHFGHCGGAGVHSDGMRVAHFFQVRVAVHFFRRLDVQCSSKRLYTKWLSQVGALLAGGRLLFGFWFALALGFGTATAATF